MKKQLPTLVVGLTGLVIGIAAIFLFTPKLYAISMNEFSPSGEVVDAVYPLFSSGISWSPKVSVSIPPRSNYNPTSNIIAGYQTTSLPTASTKDIGGTVEPLRNYYDQLLLKNGWAINVKYEADGPGGSLWGFTKGNQILILSYTSTFYDNQPNAPAQCPCTVVFTIIGGTLE